MTAFAFFAVSAWIMLGVVCLAVAAVIIYCIVVGLKNHKEQRRIVRGINWSKYTESKK